MRDRLPAGRRLGSSSRRFRIGSDFILPTADHPLPSASSVGFGDDSTLAFTETVALMKDHNPIFCFAKFVRQRRV